MGFLDSLKTWFRSESAEAKDLLGDTKSRMASDLDRREADLAASPAERLEQIQNQIAEDDSFDALRDKIEGRGATADAVDELMVTPDDEAEIVDVEIETDAETATETETGSTD